MKQETNFWKIPWHSSELPGSTSSQAARSNQNTQHIFVAFEWFQVDSLHARHRHKENQVHGGSSSPIYFLFGQLSQSES